MYSRITGTGRYLPERVLTNDDLEGMLETSAEAAGLRVMAHVFDSIYVIAESSEQLMASFKEIARRALAEHGLKVALKSPDGVKLASA